MTIAEAEEMLSEWAAVHKSRDDRVRAAYQAGLTKSRIFELTGMSRTTIDGLLGRASDGRRNQHRPALTPEAVADCRRRASAGETIAALAREYGCGRATIRNAVRGRSWQEVQVPPVLLAGR